MKSFIELAKLRFSCRNFLCKEVEKEIIIKILEAARIAPSAANKQPWKFFVLTDKKEILDFCKCYPRDWLQTAPVIVIGCVDHNLTWKRAKDGKDAADIDISIAIDHITLAATDFGLATCWICAFDVTLCRDFLQLPEHIEPVVVLPLGYPADNANPERHDFQRKKLNEIIQWGIK